MTKRRDRSLALDGMLFIHRAGGHRLGHCGPAKSRTHERTPTLQGQRAVGDVAVGFHDELFGVGCFNSLRRGLHRSKDVDCKDSSLHRQAGEAIFLRSPVSSMPQPVFDSITVNRRRNVWGLIQVYAEDTMRVGVPPNRMAQAFVQKMQMTFRRRSAAHFF